MAKTLTTTERQTSLASFVDPVDETTETAHRTPVEQVSLCPFMFAKIRSGEVVDSGELAEIGSAVHDALGDSVRWLIEELAPSTWSEPWLRKPALVEYIKAAAQQSRPDLQPEIIEAVKPMVWGWAALLGSIHPDAILAFDGGRGVPRAQDGDDRDRRGDLGHVYTLGDTAVTYQSEFDLLYVSEHSPEILEEIDTKSGWKNHRAVDIFEAFQFCSHAALAFHNFPQAQTLNVRIWNSRRNRLTERVTFRREKLADYDARIMTGLDLWLKYKDNPNPPATPFAEKCRICPAVLQCPYADDRDAVDAIENPAFAVDRYIALKEALAAQKDACWKAVEHFGHDIEGSKGDKFGTGKPKESRRPSDPIYKGNDTGAAGP